jgi:Protein of unknown function (DUF2946)
MFEMKLFVRCPLVSVAALATYLVVHVLGGALHHHHGTENGSERLQTTSNADLQFQTAGAGDGDDEETCLLCSVLHLAQILPTALHFEAITTLTGEALSATAIIRPHHLQTATHSRGPPLL